MTYVKVEKIIFTGKQNIDWKGVERFLRKYNGETYTVQETGDIIQLNDGFADEFAGSKYTLQLRGAFAKVKANISQIIPQLVNTATNRRWIKNKAIKHEGDANGGWYRYDVFLRFLSKAKRKKTRDIISIREPCWLRKIIGGYFCMM
ncbi:MAG: hypothetical protein IJ716_02135 [Lachnospiraceae bacterium]|nr:hypothetical protein [Lachnospiraceae bacterium]